MILILTWIATSLLSTAESIAIPCSVKAYGRYLLPPFFSLSPLLFIEVAKNELGWPFWCRFFPDSKALLHTGTDFTILIIRKQWIYKALIQCQLPSIICHFQHIVNRGMIIKYWFMVIPLLSSPRATHSGSSMEMLSLFWKNRMSALTSVPAYSHCYSSTFMP